MPSRPIVTEPFARGYALLPTPRKADLADGLLILPSTVAVQRGEGVEAADMAVRSLTELLRCRSGVAVTDKAAKAAPTIKLAVRDNAVAADAPEPIRRQGYLLVIDPDGVQLTGNSPVGLFYGVQTLVQLLKFVPGIGWTLPVGRIEDWPDLELRVIHYDTKHHQDRAEAVKRLIDRAAHYKINAVAWEIEDKFAYRRHPLIGAPGAFTADEMKDLAAYGLVRHVEIIPILQMPSHNAFIGKHEKYAGLREHADNNYMLCPSNPKTIKLYKELIEELVEATPGCRYFHLGTDEPYFLGKGTACPCAEKVKTMTAGAIEIEMMNELIAFLGERGRRVMYWGEDPITPADIPLLAPGTVNAVMLSEEMSRAYKARSIQELVYGAIQGARLLFPDYWRSRSLSEGDPLASITAKIRANAGRLDNVLGCFVAAWDDTGQHSECFWLGWAVATAVGWNPDGADADESVSAFMLDFYGPSAVGMERAYRLLNETADFWIRSWDRLPSRRGPSFALRFHQRRDLALALPAVPDAETLDNRPFWRHRYADLLARAEQMEGVFAELIGLLGANILRAERERYNLEVLLSLAKLMQHQLTLIHALAGAEDALSRAREAWDRAKVDEAAAQLRAAGQLVRRCAEEREQVFQSLTATWEKARLPKGMSVGRKHFVHIQDDTKNHTADRTADLGYLVMNERAMDLEGWAGQVESVAARFARKFKGLRPVGDSLHIQ